MENSWIDSWACSLPEKAVEYDILLHSVEYDAPLHPDATQNPNIALRKRKIASSSCLAISPSSFMSVDSNNSMASTPKNADWRA